MSEERPRIGPKAAEDEVPLTPRGSGPRGLAMRAVVPNAITAAAMGWTPIAAAAFAGAIADDHLCSRHICVQKCFQILLNSNPSIFFPL